MTAVTPGETTGFDRIVVTCPATAKPVGSVPVARRADVGTVAARLTVMKVRDAREAIQKANDSRYGLSGSVWTRDQTKGMELAKQMRTGSVNINNAIMSVFQYPLPMHGWKDSWPGSRAGGPEGIRKYCRTKGIAADRVAMKKELFWYPYTPWKGRITSSMARLVGARDWRRRLGRSATTSSRQRTAREG